MDQKLTDAQKMNERFAEVVLTDAMQVIGQRIEEERACSGFSVEAYYSVEIPFDEGTAEYAHFEQMLGHGSMKDPNYIDLSERIMKGIKARLKEMNVRPFIALNCRFDAELEDNFLLYVFASI